MERREFLKIGFAICGTTAITAFIASCSKTSSTIPQGPSANFTIDLGNSTYSSLNTVGGYAYNSGIIIVRTGSGNTDFVALAESCTHAGCTIGYNSNGKDFVCPCHGGTYDLNGNVTSGPPPSPVKKYSISRNGNVLTIAG